MNKQEIENILKDYHWMLNSIKIMRESLKDAGENITAQYGIESTLPKGKGGTSDPVLKEVIRRNKYWRSVHGYEEKVSIIQKRIHLIENQKEKEVLHWILEGKSYRWISRHMKLSETHVRRIKDSIVSQMAHMSQTA